MAIGLEEGACHRCEYLDAIKYGGSRDKKPLPSEWEAGSQVLVGCGEAGRLFTTGHGPARDETRGPLPYTAITCIGGEWRGEALDGGHWISLDNITCSSCLQVGTAGMKLQAEGGFEEVHMLSY